MKYKVLFTDLSLKLNKQTIFLQKSEVTIDCAEHSIAVQTELKHVSEIINSIYIYNNSIAFATEEQSMTIKEVANNT
jgi:hypothetical protein